MKQITHPYARIIAARLGIDPFRGNRQRGPLKPVNDAVRRLSAEIMGEHMACMYEAKAKRAAALQAMADNERELGIEY